MTAKPESVVLKPCPFCGDTPDVNGPHTFQSNQGDKWGYVVCCCNGPEVRTDYMSVEHWKADAITAWNTRALERGVGAMVPEGWIVDGIGSHFLDDDSLEYTAELARRDEGGSCLEWIDGTGPTIEAAIKDAAERVTK